MNNRILLVAAVAGLAIIIGIVGFSGQLIINDVSEGGIIQMSEHGSTGVKPLIMDLEELDISNVMRNLPQNVLPVQILHGHI